MKKRLTVLALAFAMVLTMSSSVFADKTLPAAGNNAKAPDAAYLVKYLKKAEGVADPNASFTFTLKAQDQQVITVEDSDPVKTSTTAAKTDYPKNGADITTSAIAASSMTSADITGTSDTVGMIKISDIFKSTEDNPIKFKRAGEYVYEVSENATFTEDSDAKTKETMNNDTQKYYLHLYVINKGTGNDTEIEKVSVENEDGEKVDPSDVDPTPGTGSDDPQRTDPDYKANGFTFTNEYKVETQNPEGTDPVDPDDPASYGGFGVSKTVDGKYADRTKDFKFTVTITKPTGSTATTGKYVISSMNDETQAMSAGAPQSFTYGTPFEVDMHHGEHFGITEMELGSKVTIVETAAQYYTPKASGLITVAEATSDNVNCGNTTPVVVGSSNKGQVAAFTNTMKDEDAPTPTGIIINNLPYVLLIGLALGGIVLFSRKRRYE